MAITSVKATINGTQYTLTNSSGNNWTATITAPGATSRNQSGGYYNVSVAIANNAGTTANYDGSTLSGLRLVVRETVAPVITITSPTTGSYVTNNKQPVVFTITDASGGSGVDTSSVVVKLDNTAVASSTLARTSITNGYQYTYTPASAYSDGSHTVTITGSDLDGNAATAKSTTFTVDTVPPSLTVTSPAAGLITNNASLTISGTTNDATSSPVTVKITLRGTDQGAVTVNSSGAFSKAVTLAEGSNAIVVTATDAAGQTSSVSRTVTLDTSVPKITSAVISPNPVDTGKTMVITITVQ